MSQGIEVVNHPSGRVTFVTRRNAERMVKFGTAETGEDGRLTLLPLYWEKGNQHVLALARGRRKSAPGYDQVNRLMGVIELRNTPVVSPARMLNFGRAGKARAGVKVLRPPLGKSSPVRHLSILNERLSR